MNDIDQDLYSRQLYVLGNQAMSKLTKSKILLYGLGAVGIEIAKNLVLAGIGSLTLIDEKICSLNDYGTQFFIKKDHVDNKTNRAQASLSSIQELNSYVKIKYLEKDLKNLTDDEMSGLVSKFDCIILTDLKDLTLSIKLNETCRKSNVKFLMSDVYGLFGWSFSDFGDNFTVNDLDGEEYKEEFIGSISKSEEAVVETSNDRLHHLETGDLVQFSEIVGMQELNNKICKVKVINAKKFSIDVDTREFESYQRGGLFKQIKNSRKIDFSSLQAQLNVPDLITSDLNEQKFLNPYLVHICLISLNIYLEKNLAKFEDYHSLVKLKFEEFKSSNSGILNGLDITDKHFDALLKIVYFSSRSQFPSLCAIFGGIVAQEAIKSITGKFSPNKQWLHLECSDLYEINELSDIGKIESIYSSLVRSDRYDSLRICFGGEATLEKLKKSKIFMVGCGAIGCEMLKNYALLGIACDQNSGSLTITDNDLIEKSNLNRQFLFRSHDIQKSKSIIAAGAIKKMNSDINIIAYEKKVCAQTEAELFTDSFFSAKDVCVNALDNVEARRYMDNRCVSNKKPLIETGTLGAKGHVQVIVPYITESYNSQRDPNDSESEIPYCTLKSFPANIEHCIQWSRDKFESIFKIKPDMFEKFFSDNQDIDKLITKLTAEQDCVVDGSVKVAKFIRNFCFDWSSCLLLARIKFEKYFANKAKDLLHVYPLDHLMKDGSPFWTLPKRPPQPVKFDSGNKLHLDFVFYLARLFADVFGVTKTESDDLNHLKRFLDDNESKVPVWQAARNKHIEVDEHKKKEQVQPDSSKDLDNNKQAEIFKEFFLKMKSLNKSIKLNSLSFEKDNDQNGHIDFIWVTSNLRASMYSIEHSDRLQVKKIAGKIVPAIATTTSCIAGYASIELVKLIQTEWEISKFRNLFLNLAIPLFLLSEPGPCAKTKITDKCSVTLWDTWSIKGSPAYTLRNFIDSIKEKYSLTVSGVIHGSKPVYMPIMPAHAKRLNETMLKLIKKGPTEDYVDLFLTYAECDSDETNRDKNNLCPPIRYFF